MSKYYSIHEFSKILGVSAQTLRNWDNNGKLHPHHTTASGYRYYSDEELNQVMNIKPKNNRITIGYCRVSSHKQKADLERQIDNVKMYLTAKGQPFEIISDIGSGINYKKKGLQDLIKRISQNQVEKVVVLYKDRLLRFGFELVEYMASLCKRKHRLQRGVSRKYDKNKEGESYCKTKNIVKNKKLLLKVEHRLRNIRKNYLNQTTSEIINRKPRFICIEDLNVSEMMKNRHLSKAVQNQGFFEFRKQLEYKCNDKGIQLIVADRFYPSSKLCSCCGAVKKELKLSDRIYRCECGNVIDRDFQASLNLKAYGEQFAS